MFDSKEGTLCLEDREPTFPFYVVGRAGAWKSGNRRDGWVRVTTGWTVRVLPELENSRTAVLATLHAFPTARLVPSRPARTAVFWSGCLSPAAIFRAHACAVKTRAQRVAVLAQRSAMSRARDHHRRYRYRYRGYSGTELGVQGTDELLVA